LWGINNKIEENGKNKMKTIGIVGGVGPEASNKFCELLIENQHATRDQDHLPFIHFCNPQIPDRTDFIMGHGQDPTPKIVETCKTLEKAGADFLVIPCNTAHFFLSRVQDKVTIPIVDMTKVLVKNVMEENPFMKRIGILATTGSMKAGLYQKYFKEVGVEAFFPNMEDQEKLVMGAIYGEKGIKAGNKIEGRKKLLCVAQKLINNGAESLILGCTEIPLVLNDNDFNIRLFDPMDLVAKEIVKYIREEKEKDEVVTVRYVIEEIAIKVRAEIVKRNKKEEAVVTYSESVPEVVEITQE